MRQPFTFRLCADDYAMTPAVSAGIREALAAGALNATSVMTTSPWWPAEAAALAPFRARASIGLHLNLTLGAPLGPMPVLAPSGQMPGIGAWLTLSRGHHLPSAEIAAEIDRQLDRFIELFGTPPDHLDGHQHVHVLAPIRPLVFAALQKRQWRPWLRDCADRPWAILRRGSSLKKSLGVAWLARGFRQQATDLGFAVNRGFAGFSSFDPATPFARSFATFLTAPGPHHLVMCHPGRIDAALRALDPVVETREAELMFFRSPAFRTLLEQRRATLEAIEHSTRDRNAR